MEIDVRFDFRVLFDGAIRARVLPDHAYHRKNDGHAGLVRVGDEGDMTNGGLVDHAMYEVGVIAT